MLLSLLNLALASAPTFTSSTDVHTDRGRQRIDTDLHIGLDLTGWQPGLGARFDIGHRFSVEGKVYGGIPMADELSWTGGSSVGLHVAPLHVELGAGGELDLSLGVGARAGGRLGGDLQGAPWDLDGWLSTTLEVSPDGRWTLFGGLLATDLTEQRPTLLPTAGLRVKLD